MVTAYNPQEWGRNGPVGGVYVPHAASSAGARARGTREMTGMEAAMPEPPPPYTQSPSAQPSPQAAAVSLSHTNSPSSFPYGSIATQQQSMQNTFPPPPTGQRDRSMSRTRNMFSAFTSRTRPQDAPVQASEAGARLPAPLNLYSSVGDQNFAAPGARRAVSAGAVSHATPRPGGFPGDQTVPSEQARDTGMALPPPPPGPPPGSRSQSLSRVPDRHQNEQHILSPVPKRIAQLGPVPPTPADWVDEDEVLAPPAAQPAVQEPRVGLQLNTQFASAHDGPGRQLPTSVMSAVEQGQVHGTSRSLAGLTRDNSGNSGTSGRGIRERRSEARAIRASSREPQSAVDGSSNPFHGETEEAKPANLVLSSSNNAITRKRHVARQPTSPLVASGPPSASRSSKQEQPQPLADKKTGAAEPSSAASLPANRSVAFSPGLITSSFSTGFAESLRDPAGRAPKSTASSVTKADFESTGVLSARSTGTDRPISHIFHTPNEEVQMLIPLTPQRPSSSTSPKAPLAVDDAAKFANASLHRHRIFAEKEAAASSDVERLELFAEFIVYESRLRRHRYSEAFDSLGSDVLDLTRDLWRTFATSKRAKPPHSSSAGPKSTTPVPPLQPDSQPPREPSSASSGPGSGPGSGPESAPFTPLTEPDTSPAVSSGGRFRSDSTRNNTYQPCLSPIPSMAMSSGVDEQDSRGRSASRWWESETSNSVGNGGRKIERSKRESKYMGVPREAIQNLQWGESQTQSSPMYRDGGTPGPSTQYASLGPDQYPPEKVGWHDPETPSSLYSAQLTPQPRSMSNSKLDVSRLITLPPPYPRHHPAVNNSHPDLASIRASLSLVNGKSDLDALRDRYTAHNEEDGTLADTVASIAERRRELRVHIQGKVGQGAMSFADAAKAEAEFDDRETKRSRGIAQRQFDSFQSGLVSPLSAAITERIVKATACIDQLRAGLNDDAQNSNPNLAQEQGDEQPELLEKVTLMKWFFDAREQLYKEHFDLQAESDAKYKHVILAPYRAAGNLDKVREVDAFFTKDSLERRVEHEKKATRRFDAFLQIVEENVARGVESQLSAFWDIAPPLLELIQRVPQELSGFDVQVPLEEYEENPSYNEFPSQYLYTLLLHTEKSAYQFIESQINLLCLLHEVKMAATVARCRSGEAERLRSGEDLATVQSSIQHTLRSEDERLTVDLKERVALVDDQWREALGQGLRSCKERIEVFLIENGGWDDSLQE